MITVPVKRKFRNVYNNKGIKDLGAGEGVLLDGFVVGVEGGL